MKWFKHFTNAHNNNDLTKVRMKYGAEGYAIYWYCLELVAGDLGHQENITFELKHDAEVIGYNLKIDSTLVEEIMRYMISLGLFEENDSIITCLKLAKYLDKRNTRNKEIHRVIDSLGESPTVADNSRQSEIVAERPRSCTLEEKRGEEKRIKRERRSGRFTPPSLEDVGDYVRKKHLDYVDAESFINFYESKGWMVGKSKMKNWKSAISGWNSRNRNEGSPVVNSSSCEMT